MIRLALSWLFMAILAHAVPVTLNFSAQGTGGALGGTNGADLPAGCRVMIGTFTLTPAQIQAAAADQFTLLAAFQPWATANIGTFNGTPQNVPGAFSSSVSIESSSHVNKRIYLWAFNSSSPASASAHILLSAPLWIVPSFGSVTCETSQIPFTDPGSIVIATRAQGTTSTTLGGPLNQAVPLAHPDDSDLDHDGIPALIEWATGSDPSKPDTASLQINNRTLTFSRFTGATGTPTNFTANGLRYQIESSQNMTSWQPLPPEEIQSVGLSPHPARAGMETMTLPLLPDARPRRFWRLAVSRR